jgi:site-specific DNA-methyltransferase (adenine-specific)
MKTLSDKSVDCFICDLPWGQLTGSNGKQNTNKGCAWDVQIDLEKFWKEVERLAKDEHTPIIMFCNTKFGYELIKSKEDWFRYDLVWNKERGVSFLLANKMPMKSHEMIYVFSKKGAYYNRIDVKTDKGEYEIVRKPNTSKHYGLTRPEQHVKSGQNGMRCPLSIISFFYKAINGHPTEKPKALYEWLLSRYCPKDGTVLDPTAGSFNSIEVAKKLGLHGIGIEKDNTFFDRAMEKFII